MTRGCKESQRKRGSGSKQTAREREFLPDTSDDSRATLNFQDTDQTQKKNTTTTTTTTSSPNTTHHPYYGHHHHHYGGHKEYPHLPEYYYGGYPQNIHHVDLTTTQPYSQISYNVPYEQPTNFYHDDKYNVYPGLNPFYPSDQISAGTDFNRLYPSGYQPPNISDGFKPVK